MDNAIPPIAENPINPKKPKLIIIALAVCLLIIAGGAGYFLLKSDSLDLAKCGDGICGASENWKNCQQDCDKDAGLFKETVYELGTSSEIGTIIDLNDDRLLDVVVLSEKRKDGVNPEGFVNIFYQQADGSLKLSEEAYSIENGADMINAGDINNDGLVDIAMTTDDVEAYRMAFLYQSAGGRFELVHKTAPGLPTSAGCAEVGDIDGDGLNDVVRGNKPRGSVSIYYQDANHELSEPEEIMIEGAARPRTSDVRIADFDEDGKNDFAVRNGNLENGNAFFVVFYNLGGGNFEIKNFDTGVKAPMGLSDIRIGDFNNDGLMDIVASIQQAPGLVAVYLQKQGDFEKKIYPSGISDIRGLGVGDLNNDGKDDIVASSFNCNVGVSILLQTESGFTEPFKLSSPTGFGGWVNVGDVNNDGRDDIVTTNGLTLQNSGCPENSISVIEVSDSLFD